MRKLVALTALLAFLPVAHAADGKADMSVNAEFRARYTFDQAWKTLKSDADTNKNTVKHRGKIGLGFKSGEKFAAHATLIHNSIWGDVNRGDSAKETPDNSADLDVNEFYGVWMINESWNMKFGRGGFTLADGSVISQNDWEETPYAFEGVLANYEQEMFRLNLFMVKAEDNFTQGTGVGNGVNDDAETNFYGLALDWKSLPDFLKTVNFHFMQVNADERVVTGPANYSRGEMRYGIVIAGDKAGVDYKIDYAAHDGEKKVAGTKYDKSGNMMAAEVGYSMPEMMKSRFHVGYHQDSGNKAGQSAGAAKEESYDSFYTEKHGSAGMMDVLGWGNLTFMKAGYTFSPMDQTEVGIHYWKFSRSENASAATAGLNGSNYVSGTTGTSDDIGSEIDLVATKKYDGGFAINTWIGSFMPGKYLKDNNGNNGDSHMQFFVEGKMTF